MQKLLDAEGFVIESNTWNKKLAEWISADQLGLNLTETHWSCIRIVREYYAKWGTMPMVKVIRDEAKISSEEFDGLFKRGPSSSRGVLCKISGLPRLLCIAAGC